jgi:hypothetical protein
VPEVIWIFGPSGLGEIEWVDKYLNSDNTMYKVCNYYLGLTGDMNIVYYPLCPKQKYSDLLQKFTDNNLELKDKYGYYNFLPEMVCVISQVYPREWCSKCRPRVDDCSEQLITKLILPFMLTVYKCV